VRRSKNNFDEETDVNPIMTLCARSLRLILPAVLAATTAASIAAPKQLDGAAPLVLAHRGASGYLPEHTLAGYELAVKLGADYIEPDLQLSKDGVLVAMHDDTLTRTTDAQTLFPGRASYAVSEFTLAELKTMTVKPVGTASTTYPGFTPTSPDPFRIPTFQEVINLARSLSLSAGREVGIYPEAKQADPVMENKILETLIANGYTGADKVFIQSFSIDTIKSINDKQTLLGADFDLIVLSSSSTALVNYGLGSLKSFADGVGVSITGAGMTESFVDLAHAAGLLVHGYTFSKTGERRRRRISEVLRVGCRRRLLELLGPGRRVARDLPRCHSRAGILAAHGVGSGRSRRRRTQTCPLTRATHARPHVRLIRLPNARRVFSASGSARR
jgi:glycerophosphoryl diester phosphodiesterase